MEPVKIFRLYWFEMYLDEVRAGSKWFHDLSSAEFYVVSEQLAKRCLGTIDVEELTILDLEEITDVINDGPQCLDSRAMRNVKEIDGEHPLQQAADLKKLLS